MSTDSPEAARRRLVRSDVCCHASIDIDTNRRDLTTGHDMKLSLN